VHCRRGLHEMPLVTAWTQLGRMSSMQKCRSSCFFGDILEHWLNQVNLESGHYNSFVEYLRLWYGDSAGNTIKENSSIFSLIRKMGDGGGGQWLVRMEWRPAGWSVCLPLLIFLCSIKSRSFSSGTSSPG